ncbi:late [Abeliophyllum distichum]|uniref:Late n=1 Tax=Abeliophyllum distichum TaxID=126358 RepID=A0ABD1RFS5_9LAMI
MEKAGEYKDYTAEKAKEGKDTTVGKITELKDSAADAARRAVGYLTGKKEETKQKTEETAEAAKQKAEETTQAAKEKYEETEEEARRKMEEMKIKEEGDIDDARKRAEEERDAATEGGTEGEGGGILGTLGSVKDAIKDKLTPHPTRDETGALPITKEERVVVLDAEGTPVEKAKMEVDVEAGATAATLKTADQMTGQTFNDVGRLDEEGIARVRLVRKEKM